MHYGEITGLTGRISRLVLGTMVFSPSNAELVADLLETFLAAGGTAIDTAHIYGHGDSERALGTWLAEFGRRDDLTLITKGCAPLGGGSPPRVTPEALTRDLLESLERLQVETVDLYLLHRDNPTVGVGPIIERLNEHQAAGHIRAFGASNWTHVRIAEANDYATAHGLRGFVASSPNLGLAIPREPMWPDCVSIAGDSEALDWYRTHQLPVLAWSSQASGFFSGRFSPTKFDDPAMVRVYYRDDNWRRLDRVRELAARRGCTPTQVALAWTLQQPFSTFALIGPRSRAELEDCLGALSVCLNPDEQAWLNLE
jgi:aryl-alcohol dehydrogenase-like predicted oxidoreductase